MSDRLWSWNFSMHLKTSKKHEKEKDQKDGNDYDVPVH